MLTEQEAQLQVEREQRIRDLLLMRSLDQKLEVERYQPTNIMLELNLRIVQYIYQFKAFSLAFLTLQTIQDWRKYLIVMQNSKLDVSKPVAILRDGNKKIFVNQSITRQSFGDGGVIYFLLEEFVSK